MKYLIKGKLYDPIKVGDEEDLIQEPNSTCDDCGEEQGEYHLECCDMERCPRCGGQLCYLKKLKKETDGDYVINNKGKPIATRSYQNSFDLIQKKLGIKHKGFHSLRHTFATRALESGMDIKTLSEIMGHKNPNITLARYAHSMLEHKTEMMNKLGRFCNLKSLEK